MVVVLFEPGEVRAGGLTDVGVLAEGRAHDVSADKVTSRGGVKVRG